jgi:hypothetical protein
LIDPLPFGLAAGGPLCSEPVQGFLRQEGHALANRKEGHALANRKEGRPAILSSVLFPSQEGQGLVRDIGVMQERAAAVEKESRFLKGEVGCCWRAAAAGVLLLLACCCCWRAAEALVVVKALLWPRSLAQEGCRLLAA